MFLGHKRRISKSDADETSSEGSGKVEGSEKVNINIGPLEFA